MYIKGVTNDAKYAISEISLDNVEHM